MRPFMPASQAPVRDAWLSYVAVRYRIPARFDNFMAAAFGAGVVGVHNSPG